jgi:hypothetical protein
MLIIDHHRFYNRLREIAYSVISSSSSLDENHSSKWYVEGDF